MTPEELFSSLETTKQHEAKMMAWLRKRIANHICSFLMRGVGTIKTYSKLCAYR